MRIGEKYTIDIFHAERHTDRSNFCMETNIDFNSTLVLLRNKPDEGLFKLDEGHDRGWWASKDTVENIFVSIFDV